MKADAAVSLGTLPHEIVHAIAIYCGAEDVLSLSRVSRPIREICYSWLVLKSILSSEVYRTAPGREVPPEELLKKNQFKFLELSEILGHARQSWARYAVALSRVANLETLFRSSRGNLRQLSAKRVEQYSICMSQLSCLGYLPQHPICAAVDFVEGTVHASRSHGRLTPHRGPFGVSMPCSAALEPSLTFCFALEILRGDLRRRANLTYKETGGFPDPRGVTLGPYLEELVSMLVARAGAPPFWMSGGSDIIVAAFSYFLTLRDGEPHPFFRPPVKPPSVARLPLLDPELCPFSPLRNEPYALSSPDANAQPSSAHGQRRVGIESVRRTIEDGEWCGYYTWTGAVARFDPPMEHVALTVPADPDPSKNGSYDIAGHGVDSVAGFTLTGHIDLGEPVEKPFMMRKAYVNGIAWVWEGFLTQFGFVGVWRGDERGSRQVYGVFWLWRSDWQHGVEQGAAT